MKETLHDIVLRKQTIEEQFAERVGEVTDDLEALWQDVNVQLAKKIDGYGFVLSEIDRAIKSLNDKLDQRNDKTKAAIKRLETEREKLKERLNTYANGSPLRGEEYNFHPYVSVTQKVDMDKVGADYKSYTMPKVNFEEWNLIQDLLVEEGYEELAQKILNNTKVTCNVTDLPENHPALIKSVKHSVRIT